MTNNNNNTILVKFVKLHPDAVVPSYAHDGDVGMDMTAVSVEYSPERDMYIYHTGLAFETEFHYGMFLFPRSSINKTDAYLCNSVGIADTAIYRGEILFCFKNRTSLQMRITQKYFADHLKIDDGKKFEDINLHVDPMDYAPYKPGDRVGQMVIMPYPNVRLIEADKLSETVRGANGFGSTGN